MNNIHGKVRLFNGFIANNNVDTISKIDSLKLRVGNNYQKDLLNTISDTVIILKKVNINIGGSDKSWDRILPLIGIIIGAFTLLTAVSTLAFVFVNYQINKNYGEWSGWKEYKLLRKDLNKTTEEFIELSTVLNPIINLNPLDFVDKVKENGPGMFIYHSEELRNIISKAYDSLNDYYKNLLFGAYNNLINKEGELISHRIGQNEKFKDGREFFFVHELLSFIYNAEGQVKDLKRVIEKLKTKMNNIKT